MVCTILFALDLCGQPGLNATKPARFDTVVIAESPPPGRYYDRRDLLGKVRVCVRGPDLDPPFIFHSQDLRIASQIVYTIAMDSNLLTPYVRVDKEPPENRRVLGEAEQAFVKSLPAEHNRLAKIAIGALAGYSKHCVIEFKKTEILQPVKESWRA